MIWVLIVVTMAGDVAMQPFVSERECETARKFIADTHKKHQGNWRSEAADSVCLHVANPYKGAAKAVLPGGGTLI